MGSNSSIDHTPEDRWVFDESVADCFEDMLSRSIPQHDEMRRLVGNVGGVGVADGTLVVDLGCSLGQAIVDVRRVALSRGINAVYHGLETSAPMLDRAKARFDSVDVFVTNEDVRTWNGDNCSVVLAVLTLQFIPINYRQQIIRNVFESLNPGGRFVLVEKVLGEGAQVDDLMVAHYHHNKLQQGYSRQAVRAKAESLEGVLVPVTAGMNESMLRRAGFREVDCFWRWMNFAAWVAIK